MIERYTTESMGSIWSDQNKYQVWLDVEKKSTAEESGIKVGDIIFKVDDIVVNSYQDFVNINNENLRKSGDIISLDIWRNQENIKITLELKSFE